MVRDKHSCTAYMGKAVWKGGSKECGCKSKGGLKIEGR